MSAANAYVLGMEIALRAVVSVHAHALLRVGLHFESAVNNERATRLDKLGVVAETLKISLLGAVNVEVVGIGCRNNRGIRAQVVERAVKLVGLYHHIGRRLAQQVVGAIVLGYAAKKGVAPHMALVQQVCRHRGGGSFAMRAGHAEALH